MGIHTKVLTLVPGARLMSPSEATSVEKMFLRCLGPSETPSVYLSLAVAEFQELIGLVWVLPDYATVNKLRLVWQLRSKPV